MPKYVVVVKRKECKGAKDKKKSNWTRIRGSKQCRSISPRQVTRKRGCTRQMQEARVLCETKKGQGARFVWSFGVGGGWSFGWSLASSVRSMCVWSWSFLCLGSVWMWVREDTGHVRNSLFPETGAPWRIPSRHGAKKKELKKSSPVTNCVVKLKINDAVSRCNSASAQS